MAELSTDVWRTSTYSGNQGSCVEVAGAGSRFAVRDSKDRTGPVLTFGTADWAAFVARIREA